MRVLIIIPARGGSKGIPRKNLRPLAGKPLLSYTINMALSLNLDKTVIVTSEDNEILNFSKSMGAEVFIRNKDLSKDEVTLDSVILEVANQMAGKYDFVLTVQPTSPLLKANTLEKAIQRISSSNFDSAISVKETHHLFWVTDEKNGHKPFYAERLNRQYLEPTFFETGGFVISSSNYILERQLRLSEKPLLISIPDEEAIDIDSHEDWALCEHLISRKNIAIITIGNHLNGLGHIYNCLEIANELVCHNLIFFLEDREKLALRKVKENNYKYMTFSSQDELNSKLCSFSPDILINDTLDTSEEYTKYLKLYSKKLVSIEDLGPGQKYADVVINAMYGAQSKLSEKSFYGKEYFCLRSDLQRAVPQAFSKEVKTVLLFFGGVDPGGLTSRVLSLIERECESRNIKIEIIVGSGNAFSLNNVVKNDFIEVHHNINDMASVLSRVDLAFTSGGRSTFEVSSMCIPTIVICQNSQELTHSFANEENGFINLGLHDLVLDHQIFDEFSRLLLSEERLKLVTKMKNYDLRSGRKNVLNLIMAEI